MLTIKRLLCPQNLQKSALRPYHARPLANEIFSCHQTCHQTVVIRRVLKLRKYNQMIIVRKFTVSFSFLPFLSVYLRSMLATSLHKK